jgi:peptide/nickel transport system substrate-binding protein
MFTNRKLAILVILVMVAPIVLAACGPAPEPQIVEKVVTQQVEVTKIVEKEGEQVTIVETQIVEVEKEVPVEVEVEVQVTPTPSPVDRKGGWLDMVVFLEEPSAEAAITRLNVDEMDVYGFTLSDPEIFQTVQGLDKIAYTMSYGSYRELTYNVAGPELESGLNPFANPKIREATQWLVDREYIAQEIYGGLARPKYTALTTTFPDYAKVADVARTLEAKYAHDPEKAREIINQEMEALGAELVDGKWTYNGEPVELIFVIRTEDLRRDIGDYVANLLEEVGFTIDRQYKTGAEASVLWVQSDPFEGLWHVYTAGWINNFVNRDEAGTFEFFFTPRGYPIPLWQAYTPSEELDQVSDLLNRSVFASLEERSELIAQALELSMADASHVFLVDKAAFTPRDQDTEVTGDLAAAVAGSQMNPYTLRFRDKVGGAMTFGMPSILTDPWNPIAGTNWVYDAAVQRSTQDYGMQVDPFTGLRYPQRIERAEITIKEGLPVGQSEDSKEWLTLTFEPEIAVPEDAWVDWNAADQVFVTAAEKFPEGVTANQKTVVYYPSELYSTTWHDGSPFDVADIVLNMIFYFDRGKEESAIFDSAEAGPVEAALQSFRGIRIVSEDPLVIETYTDAFALEADLIDQITVATWYPSALSGPSQIPYPYGTGGWHSIGLGILPETAGELAFSSAKADELEVDWMNYIGGPSLEILSGYLDQAAEENYIPYGPTLGQYVTAEEAAERWANYKEWVRKRGHFWIGTGPYYLEGAFPVEGTVIVKSYAQFIDNADRWSGFTSPRIAEIEVDGPGRVDIGGEASYDLYLTFEGEPYPQADIEFVNYLVFDSTGELAVTGEAAAVEDGLYQVTLTAEQTSGLDSGANRLEVVVVSKAVAIPSFGSFDFVTQ